ncbi:Serine_threonine-protein kinase PknD [Nocardiopsis dassonvillei]|uniref:serine/threonine-protein kinase n=1 Tax=Nocardiopsis dassonvillei TaxID=2014 RepID=UPI003F55BEB7
MVDPLRSDDPRTIGRYRLEGVLGGGMGRVYLGRSPGGRTVAVKVVRPELAGDEGFRRRFAREVEAARRVGGFYTAQVVDADPAADPPWLVTAYVPGPSLSEAVRRHGPLTADGVLSLAAGLAEGLAAVHEQGIVHRDLKPGNVIMAEDGPRVIDFGIARALGSGDGMTSTGIMGTPSFMAPEQIRGEGPGPATDVFALGCVLVFAATGRPPFGGGELATLVYRIVHEEPDLSGVPEELVDLVAACLSKDPAARPTIPTILERVAPGAVGGRNPDPRAVRDSGGTGAVAFEAPPAPLPGPGAPNPASPAQRHAYHVEAKELTLLGVRIGMLLCLVLLVVMTVLALILYRGETPGLFPLGLAPLIGGVLLIAGVFQGRRFVPNTSLILDNEQMTVVHRAGLSQVVSSHSIPWNTVWRVGLDDRANLVVWPRTGVRPPDGLSVGTTAEGGWSIPLFVPVLNSRRAGSRRIAAVKATLSSIAGDGFIDMEGDAGSGS